FTSGCATEPDQRGTHLIEHAADPWLPIAAVHVGKQVDVDVTVSGVTEHHRVDTRIGAGALDGVEILTQSPDRHATVLDHLQRSATVANRGENGRSCVTDRPQ